MPVRKLKFALIPAIATLMGISFAVPSTAATQNFAPLASSVAASQSAHATEYHVVTKYGTLTYGTKPLQLRPLTGSGCNQNVCLEVTGNGLNVTEWDTQGYYNGSIQLCTVGYFYVNDREIRSTPLICGGAGTFFANWAPNRNYPNQTKLCNQWKKIAGEPCLVVHT